MIALTVKNIALLLSWIASYLAMTLAEGRVVYHKERLIMLRVCYDKELFSWILGSSRACPRMTGEGESMCHDESNVRAKASLFVLDCFVPRNDASGEKIGR
jgi:hypothetical protein